MPVAFQGEVLGPLSSNVLDTKETPVPQSLLLEQMLRPLTQRPAQPGTNRHPKAHFRPVYQFDRHIPVEDLTQEAFALSVFHFHRQRHTAGELHYPVVQQRDSRLQTHRHRGAINLYQYVTG